MSVQTIADIIGRVEENLAKPPSPAELAAEMTLWAITAAVTEDGCEVLAD